MATTSNTTEIQSTKQFDDIVSSLSKDQLLVIDFHAVWCGPCKAISPVIERLADKYTEAKFIKIDVDKQKELATRFSVRAMPTFKLLKNGAEVAQLQGADARKLASLVAEHSGRDAAAVAADDTPVDLTLATGGGGGIPPLQKLLLVGLVAYYAYQWWQSKQKGVESA